MPGKRTVGRGFSLFRRGDKWHAAKDLPPGPDGARRRLDRTGRTAREAATRLHQALTERTREAEAARHLTVAAFLAQWLDDVVAPNRAPNTTRLYRGTIARHLAPALGSTLLADLTPAAIQRLYADLQRAGHLSTAVLCHAILRAALGVAEDWELLARNPARRVKVPRPPKPEKHSLTPEQARQLLAAIDAHPDGALFLTGLTTGMRIGELCGLIWSRIDWEHSRILVDQQIQWLPPVAGAPERPEFRPLKGRRAHLITTPAMTMTRLRQHQDAQGFQRRAAGALWQDWGLVFPREDGAPRRSQVYGKRWEALLYQLGLPRLTLHELRHSYSTLARTAGVPIETAADTLGHAGPGLLLSTYSHVLEEHKAAAAEALERLLTEDG